MTADGWKQSTCGWMTSFFKCFAVRITYIMPKTQTITSNYWSSPLWIQNYYYSVCIFNRSKRNKCQNKNLHFLLCINRACFKSIVARPNKASAFKVWWLQTRNSKMVCGVTLLKGQNCNKNTQPYLITVSDNCFEPVISVNFNTTNSV